MKKILLHKSILTIIAIVFLSFFSKTNAQSLVMGALPNPTVVGTSANFTFTYTSTVPCALYAEMRRFDYIDGVLTQNYNNTYVVGSFSSALPASSTDANGTVSFTIPGNTPVSASLPADKRYAWIFKLTPGVGDYNQVAGTPFIYEEALITASSNVVDYIAFTSPPPAAVAVGTTQTLNISYTFAGERNLKVGLTKYDANGNYVASGPASYLTNIPATTTTPVTTTIDVVVPADTEQSTALGPLYYKWEFSYYTVLYGYLGGLYTTDQVTVGPALATTNFTENNKSILLQNPVGSELLLNEKIDFKTATIYDMMGKQILTFSKSQSNNVNVSNLSKGLYLIVTDTNLKTKFIKQ